MYMKLKKIMGVNCKTDLYCYNEEIQLFEAEICSFITGCVLHGQFVVCGSGAAKQG